MNNILNYVRMLEWVGLTREQAETHIKILSEIMEDKLASKQDLILMEERINFRFEKLEAKMTIKLGAMLGATIAITATLQKLFLH